MDEYTIEQLNPHYCLTYLIGTGTDVIIVDPVLDELERYVALLKEKGLNLVSILETHTHADHISGAAALKDRTGADLYMHELAPAKCVYDPTRLKDGDHIELAGIPIRVLHTPGHTKDSVSYLLSKHVLTGDALFLDDGGAGRDDLPGGDPADHWASLQKLMSLEGGLIVHPAHDYRHRTPSSLANQRLTNPHVQKALEGRDAFINYITNLKLGPADWMKDVLTANYACAIEPGHVWVPSDSASCEVKGTLSLGANEQDVASITPRELRALQDNKDPLLLIDVREPLELAGDFKPLEGSLNIPITELPSRLPDIKKAAKGKKIVSICKMGGRSFTAGQILKQDGISDVVVLEGGLIAWKNAFGDSRA